MELPVGLKKIGEYSFHGNAFKHFHFPSTVAAIGKDALSYCRELESVTLPSALKVIPNDAFLGCFKLKDISIPKSVAHVGAAAFASCRLTHLDLSRCNLTSIGRSAISHCSQLRDILLPSTLTRIEARSFEGCASLTHLWIPPTVELIDYGAFVGCTSLLSVEVPETLKRVRFLAYCPLRYNNQYGYNSLVNFCLPRSHVLDPVVHEYDFMEDIKLGEAANGYEDLVSKLKQRFNCLPLHRACYFQSYHTIQDNIDSIQDIAKADPAACSRVDFAGMTPLHILALSHRPRLKLFQELLSLSSVDIMRSRDVFGCTPWIYLCKNHSTTAACVTKSLLLCILEPRILFLGLDHWRDEIMSGLEKVQLADATSLATEVA
ncbi:unnamed protein product [Cylindrotheca closterium]|uniref:Uncharacterized protein n=1 Tax=Cylindrotheca closterium TaxID=2856 RepID=A0AAD2G7E7_9STRA|nr:unnamed protein product [Cylindrotheca closterium]